MKKAIYAIALMICATYNASYAQSAAAPALFRQSEMTKGQPVKKPDARAHGRPRSAAIDTLPRLIATRFDTFSHTFSLIATDSSSFSYSHGRGGDMNTQAAHQNFDLTNAFVNNGSQWVPDQRATQTFDSNNNVIATAQMQYVSGMWVNWRRDFYAYDIHNNQTIDTSYVWTSGVWVLSNLAFSVYDSADSLLQSGGYTYSSGNWIPQNGTINTYDSLHHLIQIVTQNGNGTTAWQNVNKIIYQYDINNDAVFGEGYRWVSGAWQIDSRDSITYNSHHNSLTTLIQAYSAGSWVNFSLEIDSYNISGVNKVQWKTYSGGPGGWTPIDIVKRSFDQYGYVDTFLHLIYSGLPVYDTSDMTVFVNNAFGKQTYYLDYTWASGAWAIASPLVLASYDAYGNLTGNSQRTWTGSSWGMNGDGSDTITYNSHQQFLTGMDLAWDSVAGGFIPLRETFYWYNDSVQEPLDVNEPAKNILSSVYPNPFSNTFDVSFDAAQGGEATLILYDARGRLLTRTVTTAYQGINTITWDAGYALPTGIYIYELSIGNAISRGRIVRE